MKRALALVAVLVLAGCGGAKTITVTKVPPKPSADPGRDAFLRFSSAAAAGRTDLMWSMLSTASQRRLGPTLGAFRRGAGGGLVRSVGPIRDAKVIVSERITPAFGVVAVDGRRNGKRVVYAVPLRLEGTRWKLELGGPVKIRPLGPLPGAHEPVVAQIGIAVTGPGGTGSAVMYLDGHTENPKVAGTSTNATLYANFDPALDPGRHTVVVFASDGDDAGATGWDFTAG